MMPAILRGAVKSQSRKRGKVAGTGHTERHSFELKGAKIEGVLISKVWTDRASGPICQRTLKKRGYTRHRKGEMVGT